MYKCKGQILMLFSRTAAVLLEGTMFDIYVQSKECQTVLINFTTAPPQATRPPLVNHSGEYTLRESYQATAAVCLVCLPSVSGGEFA